MPRQLENGTWERTNLQADKDHTDIGSNVGLFNNTNVDYNLLSQSHKNELERLRQEYNKANDNFRPYLNNDRGTIQQQYIDYANSIISNPNSYYDKDAVLENVNTQKAINNADKPSNNSPTLVIGGTDEAGNSTRVNLANETLEQLIPAISSGIPLQGIEVTNPDGSKSTIDPKALTGALNKTQQQEQAKMIEQVGIGAVLGKFGEDLRLRGKLAELQQQGNYGLALNNQQNTATITKSMLDNWLGSSELANQRASTILNARL